MDISLNTIPPGLLAFAMIYTGFIWTLSRGVTIRMDSRIFAGTFIFWGLLYLIAQFAPPRPETMETLIARVFIIRTMLLMLCMSQALPLTVSYIRSKRNAFNSVITRPTRHE